MEVATDCFRGIDKDAFLSRVCKAYVALIGDGRGGVFCQNALDPLGTWPALMRQKIKLESFDIVLTNPPFGKKIVVKGDKVISQYDLGQKWKYNKEADSWENTGVQRDQLPPQIAFLEKVHITLEARRPS